MAGSLKRFFLKHLSRHRRTLKQMKAFEVTRLRTAARYWDLREEMNENKMHQLSGTRLDEKYNNMFESTTKN